MASFVRNQRKIFTTGQIANICKVAPRTVSKWFDSGKLKGYRIPGSQDRRIPRAQLIRFLKDHGMPLGELAEPDLVLLVGFGGLLGERLMELLPVTDGFRVEATASLFDAGLLAHDCRPLAVVVDGSIGWSEMRRVVEGVRSNGSAGARLVAVVGADGEAVSQGTLGYDDVFVDPVDPEKLAGLIRSGREG